MKKLVLDTILRNLVVTLACGLVMVTMTAPQPAGAADKTMKVVWHVDYKDPDRFSATLTSLYNMASTYDSELTGNDIRIVFVGQGIRFLTDDKLKKTPLAEDRDFAKKRAALKRRLQSLQKTFKIKLELCNITVESLGLQKSSLYPGVTLVQSGVVRIAELQTKGYAYIKMQ